MYDKVGDVYHKAVMDREEVGLPDSQMLAQEHFEAVRELEIGVFATDEGARRVLAVVKAAIGPESMGALLAMPLLLGFAAGYAWAAGRKEEILALVADARK